MGFIGKEVLRMKETVAELQAHRSMNTSKIQIAPSADTQLSEQAAALHREAKELTVLDVSSPERVSSPWIRRYAPITVARPGPQADVRERSTPKAHKMKLTPDV